MKKEIRSIWLSRHSLLLGVAAVLLVLFSMWD